MTSVTVNNLHQEMTTQVVVVYIECYTTNAVKIFPFKFIILMFRPESDKF